MAFYVLVTVDSGRSLRLLDAEPYGSREDALSAVRSRAAAGEITEGDEVFLADLGSATPVLLVNVGPESAAEPAAEVVPERAALEDAGSWQPVEVLGAGEAQATEGVAAPAQVAADAWAAAWPADGSIAASAEEDEEDVAGESAAPVGLDSQEEAAPEEIEAPGGPSRIEEPAGAATSADEQLAESWAAPLPVEAEVIPLEPLSEEAGPEEPGAESETDEAPAAEVPAEPSEEPDEQAAAEPAEETPAPDGGGFTWAMPDDSPVAEAPADAGSDEGIPAAEEAGGEAWPWAAPTEVLEPDGGETAGAGEGAPGETAAEPGDLTPAAVYEVDPLEEPAVDTSDLVITPAADDTPASVFGEEPPAGTEAEPPAIDFSSLPTIPADPSDAPPEYAIAAAEAAVEPMGAYGEPSAEVSVTDSDWAALAEPVAVEDAESGADKPSYEPGSDIAELTCDDCVYLNTCPKQGSVTPAACGSFQWRS